MCGIFITSPLCTAASITTRAASSQQPAARPHTPESPATRKTATPVFWSSYGIFRYSCRKTCHRRDQQPACAPQDHLRLARGMAIMSLRCKPPFVTYRRPCHRCSQQPARAPRITCETCDAARDSADFWSILQSMASSFPMVRNSARMLPKR